MGVTISNRGDDPVVVFGADGNRTDLGAGSVAHDVTVPARIERFEPVANGPVTTGPFTFSGGVVLGGVQNVPRDEQLNGPLAGGVVLTLADSLADLHGLPRPGSPDETDETAAELDSLVVEAELEGAPDRNASPAVLTLGVGA